MSQRSPRLLADAMLSGRAVIATEVGIVPEVLGPAGLVVPPRSPRALADACLALLGDEERRARLGLAAGCAPRSASPWSRRPRPSARSTWSWSPAGRLPGRRRADAALRPPGRVLGRRGAGARPAGPPGGPGGGERPVRGRGRRRAGRPDPGRRPGRTRRARGGEPMSRPGRPPAPPTPAPATPSGP
ncbi:glycosyltransferase [Kitasatospora arboriphila]